MPDAVPVVTYEDGQLALDWLAEAFGFVETARLVSPDGRLAHGEMSIGDGMIMLASPSPDYQGPRRHREHCEIAAAWSSIPWIIDGILVYVQSVDEHYAKAKAAGAVILSEPEDGPPARRYRIVERQLRGGFSHGVSMPLSSHSACYRYREGRAILWRRAGPRR